MKKSYPLIFLIFSLAIIITAGIYTWYTNNQQAATIAHIPDPDWSNGFCLSSDARSATFDSAVDSKGNLHTVWIKYNRSTGIEDLLYTVTNTAGKSIIPTKSLGLKDDMTELALVIAGDNVHIFWAGSDTPLVNKLDLYYIKLDLKGNILTQEQVLTDEFQDIYDLDVAATTDGNFLLIWSDRVGEYQQLKTLQLGADGHPTGTPYQLTASTYHSTKPTLFFDGTQYHLAWLEEQQSYNNHQLFYQKIDSTGKFTGFRTAVDIVNREEDDIPLALAVHNNRIYLIYTKIMYSIGRINSESNIEKKFLNYELFGSTLDAVTGEVKSIDRLTEKNGVSYDPWVTVDNDGAIHLLYIDTYVNHLALTHKIYKDDFKTLLKDGRRLYPHQTFTLLPQMIGKPDTGLYITWIESNGEEMFLFAANTVKPHKPSFFQIIGMNTGYFGFSAFLSTMYLFTAPLLIMFFHLGMISIYALGLFGLTWLANKVKLGFIFTNRFVMVIILCLTHYLVYYKPEKLSAFFWPSQPTMEQLPAIFAIASIAALIYIVVNKFEDENIVQAAVVAVVWAYWLNIVNLCMNLQYLNFFS